LGEDEFPRVSITTINESSTPMGIFDDTQYANVTFQIDIISRNDQVFTVTTTDEALGTVSSSINSNRLTFTTSPYTVTNIKHTTTAYGTVTSKTTNSDFTSPASLSADVIEWSKSTGDLNLNAADVSADNGEALTSTSVIKLSNLFLCSYLAREIYKLIKNNWRTDSTLNGLFNPLLINSSPFPFDEDLSVFRHVMEYSFKCINPHEGI